MSTVSKVFEIEGEVMHAVAGCISDSAGSVPPDSIEARITHEGINVLVQGLTKQQSLPLAMAMGRRVKVTVEVL